MRKGDFLTPKRIAFEVTDKGTVMCVLALQDTKGRAKYAVMRFNHSKQYSTKNIAKVLQGIGTVDAKSLSRIGGEGH